MIRSDYWRIDYKTEGLGAIQTQKLRRLTEMCSKFLVIIGTYSVKIKTRRMATANKTCVSGKN